MIKLFLLFFLLSAVCSKRISEKKCEEFKTDVEHVEYHGGTLENPRGHPVVTYDCHGITNTGFVVGGVEARPGEFPHMAAIAWERPNGNLAFKCGGSLISDRFVLTAAHCGWDETVEGPPTRVRLGVQNLANEGSALGREINIKKFIRHPEYIRTGKINDIALIELEEIVKFDNKTLRPACLQQEEYSGIRVTATGWGQNETDGQTMDTLMKVALPIAEFKKCKAEHNDTLNAETQICAGGIDKKDTCGGDSGAPIQYSRDEIPCLYFIVGFTSYGNKICGKGHAVYTKTLPYLDWIEEIVWPRSEEPTETTTLPVATTKSRYVRIDSWE